MYVEVTLHSYTPHYASGVTSHLHAHDPVIAEVHGKHPVVTESSRLSLRAASVVLIQLIQSPMVPQLFNKLHRLLSLSLRAASVVLIQLIQSPMVPQLFNKLHRLLSRLKLHCSVHNFLPQDILSTVLYTKKLNSACRRSDCQLLRTEGAMWSA
jgi:hypothetical protein